MCKIESVKNIDNSLVESDYGNPKSISSSLVLPYNYSNVDDILFKGQMLKSKTEIEKGIEEKLSALDAEELERLFSIRTGQLSYIEYMKRFCDRKFNSDFSREMSRSVGVYLKDFLHK